MKRSGSILILALGVVGLSMFAGHAFAQIGPDVITGIVSKAEAGGTLMLGREGSIGSGTVGLGVSTTSCNKGDMTANWFELPNVDHPLMLANLYRLRTVAGSDRLEQIGQSWLKHGFGSSNDDECGFGCQGARFNELGVGCSDTYGAWQFEPCGIANGLMAPRSAINPYTVEMAEGPLLGPGGGCDLNYPSANHEGHNHTTDPNTNFASGISHRLQVLDVDLMPDLNPGVRYFVEGQYLSPHEARDGNGNQNNNASHRELGVVGPFDEKVFPFTGGTFGFVNLSDTFAESPAIDAWPGASQTPLDPAPLADGHGVLGYEVTDLGDGTWHYEYAIYNMNLDRAFGSLRVPIPDGVTVSNIDFHAPLNHAPELHADNYPNTPWAVSLGDNAITWSTDPFDVNPLANAVRYATMYNFRFDADSPPKSVLATVGLFKTSGEMSAATLGPRPLGVSDCNDNGIDDSCDLDCSAAGCDVPGCGESTDCDGTGVPDECEIDCNSNGIDDRCDVASGFSADCSGNLVPDECEPDCDQDGVADVCQLINGTAEDCNANRQLDSCDLSQGISVDVNGDGVPDDCCLAASAPLAVDIDSNSSAEVQFLVGLTTGRVLVLHGGDPGKTQAIRVRFAFLPPPWDAWNGTVMWVTAPEAVCDLSGVVDPDEPGCGEPLQMATLTCDRADAFVTDWTNLGTVYIHHEGIVPSAFDRTNDAFIGAFYEVKFVTEPCTSDEEPGLRSEPLAVVSSVWGDLGGGFDNNSLGQNPGPLWVAPDGDVSITTDVVAAIDSFINRPGAPGKVRVDIEPSTLDFRVNFSDVVLLLDAFRGLPYPFEPGPRPCD